MKDVQYEGSLKYRKDPPSTVMNNAHRKIFVLDNIANELRYGNKGANMVKHIPYRCISEAYPLLGSCDFKVIIKEDPSVGQKEFAFIFTATSDAERTAWLAAFNTVLRERDSVPVARKFSNMFGFGETSTSSTATSQSSPGASSGLAADTSVTSTLMSPQAGEGTGEARSAEPTEDNGSNPPGCLWGFLRRLCWFCIKEGSEDQKQLLGEESEGQLTKVVEEKTQGPLKAQVIAQLSPQGQILKYKGKIDLADVSLEVSNKWSKAVHKKKVGPGYLAALWPYASNLQRINVEYENHSAKTSDSLNTRDFLNMCHAVPLIPSAGKYFNLGSLLEKDKRKPSPYEFVRPIVKSARANSAKGVFFAALPETQRVVTQDVATKASWSDSDMKAFVEKQITLWHNVVSA
eukprot:Rmarinus@m.14051